MPQTELKGKMPTQASTTRSSMGGATDKKGQRPAVKHMSINLSVNSACHTARESITDARMEEDKIPALPPQGIEDILSKLIAGDQHLRELLIQTTQKYIRE
jgi:hypothetical protein